MRAGLVFLSGLLVGGLVVAWLVAEQPPEPTPEVALDPLPGTPAPVSRTVPQASTDASVETSVPAEEPMSVEQPTRVEEPTPTASTAEEPGAAAPVTTDTLLLPPLRIPVQGIEASELFDSFADARGQGRVHDAIDIMAAEGTPVLAAADGPVVKLFDSVPGGTTLYQFDQAGQVAYYYAHMQRYAEGIEEGMQLRRGQTIGYVGHTGNADPAAPHLHFAIFVLGPEKRWWEGEAINPYPLLASP